MLWLVRMEVKRVQGEATSPLNKGKQLRLLEALHSAIGMLNDALEAMLMSWVRKQSLRTSFGYLLPLLYRPLLRNATSAGDAISLLKVEVNQS